MNHEDARTVALAMLAALGEGWVMDLIDNHGFMPSVKNGPCSVTFNENSRTYSASIKLGSMFSAYGSDPVLAIQAASRNVETHVQRIAGEWRSIQLRLPVPEKHAAVKP